MQDELEKQKAEALATWAVALTRIVGQDAGGGMTKSVDDARLREIWGEYNAEILIGMLNLTVPRPRTFCSRLASKSNDGDQEAKFTFRLGSPTRLRLLCIDYRGTNR